MNTLALLKKLALLLSETARIDEAALREGLALDVACATVTTGATGLLILNGARLEQISVGVLVNNDARRTIVLSPEAKGGFGVFETPPDLPGGETLPSKTGLGFVWRAPLDGVIVGVSANLPDKAIQTVYAQDR